MRTVLITNHAMVNRSGTEMYVQDLAPALLRHGWSPIVYSLRQGEAARLLRDRSIPVVEDLSLLEAPPDIIHGQHHLDAMVAMLTFPATPALYFCHGFLPWEEMAVCHPNIGRYVAVDELCRERLMFEHGIPAGKIETFLNFVDLAAFSPRSPLPPNPGKALIFSNGMERAEGMGQVIAEACAHRGIQLDFAGRRSKTATDKPGELLAEYDLVFAKARCALEAMATGCAVIVADVRGMAGMVTAANYESWRPYNFGLRTLQAQRHAGPEDVLREIDAYNPGDAALVSKRARRETDLESYTAKIAGLYETVIAEHRSSDPALAFRATASYLGTISGKVKEANEYRMQIKELRNELARYQQAERRGT